MAWVVTSVNRNMNAKMDEEDDDMPEEESLESPEGAPPPMTKSASLRIVESFPATSRAKEVVSFVMHYTMFFLCYGASRAICQPWMWELHFWLVIMALVLTLVLTIVFVV